MKPGKPLTCATIPTECRLDKPSLVVFGLPVRNFALILEVMSVMNPWKQRCFVSDLENVVARCVSQSQIYSLKSQGNPVSSLVTFHLVVNPCIRCETQVNLRK